MEWTQIVVQVIIAIGILGAAYIALKKDKPTGDAALKEAESKGEERASMAWADYAKEQRDARLRMEDKLDRVEEKLDKIEPAFQKCREEMAKMGNKFEEWINGNRTSGS